MRKERNKIFDIGNDDPNCTSVSFSDALAACGAKPQDSNDDRVTRRVLEDYGAIFVACSRVIKPPVCMFTSDAEVYDFQDSLAASVVYIDGVKVELQSAAMEALLAARQAAHAHGLEITPRGGTEASRRTYGDTLRLWNSRFLPALQYWRERGRLTGEQAVHLESLPIRAQVLEVLELEKDEIFFSKDFSKSILYSVAVPGASQHLSMLALDVQQFEDERVRKILSRHGWHQTVNSDFPHFTFLGFAEKILPSLGLRSMKAGEQLFWVPNIIDEL